jgi:hypothetical protein
MLSEVMNVRLFLAALVVVASSVPARAEHGDPYLFVAPQLGGGIPANGRIRLFSDNGAAGPLYDPQGYELRLRVGRAIVPLRTERTRRGFNWDGYGSSSVSLVPTSRLPVGGLATLEIRARPRGAWAPLFDGGWTVEASDRDPPSWTASLGPHPEWSASARLVVEVEDQSEVTLRVDVIDASGTRSEETVRESGSSEDCAGFDASSDAPLEIRAYPVDATGLRGEPRTFRLEESVDYVHVCTTRRPPAASTGWR